MKYLGLLFLLLYLNTTYADVIWLNEVGQEELETSDMPKEGVIRDMVQSMEGGVFQMHYVWQPYRPEWEDQGTIEIDYKWLRKPLMVISLIDTQKDLDERVEKLNNWLDQGVDKDAKGWLLVRHCTTQYARFKHYKEEADSGLTQNCVEQVKRVFALTYPDYNSLPEGSAEKEKAGRYAYSHHYSGQSFVYGLRLDESTLKRKHYTEGMQANNDPGYVLDPRLYTYWALDMLAYFRQSQELDRLYAHEVAVVLSRNSFFKTVQGTPAYQVPRDEKVRKKSQKAFKDYYEESEIFRDVIGTYTINYQYKGNPIQIEEWQLYTETILSSQHRDKITDLSTKCLDGLAVELHSENSQWFAGMDKLIKKLLAEAPVEAKPPLEKWIAVLEAKAAENRETKYDRKFLKYLKAL